MKENRRSAVRFLRESALRGRSPSELLNGLLAKFEIRPDERPLVMGLFEEAFGWDLRERSYVGAWHYFDGSAWTDEMVDRRLLRCLDVWVSNNARE
jgi:hypothetical protein